jgi:hypothetical protein
MPKIILTVGEAVLAVLPLTKERSTIGRRPNNDLVIDHVAISSEHAVIIQSGNDWILEDQNSTNGTEVNDHPVKRHLLQHHDVIGLAPYQIKFIADAVAIAENTSCSPDVSKAIEQVEELLAQAEDKNDNISPGKVAIVRVLDGPSVGKEKALVKAITTIGRPGVQVAVITRRRQAYFIAHVEGNLFPLINGVSIEANAKQLKFDDVIDLSGTRLIFKRQDS